MAVFAIAPDDRSYSEKLTRLAETKGLSLKKRLNPGNKMFYYFGRKHEEEASFYFEDEQNIGCFILGTAIYKKKFGPEAAKLILMDFEADEISYPELLGNYAIIIYDKDKIKILLPYNNMISVYGRTDLSFLSNSFQLATQIGPSTANKSAFVENISTGRLFGPDTLINEVKRLEILALPEFPVPQEVSVQVIERAAYRAGEAGSFRETINLQLEGLAGFFQQTKPAADHWGVNTGLTGGHDSRLLLAYVRKYWNNFQVHSHYKKKKDRELLCAENICNGIGIENIQVPVRSPLEKSSGELLKTMTESSVYYDAQSRMHCYWMEEYLTEGYWNAVRKEKLLGVAGVGGELYRNHEHMTTSTWSLDKLLFGYLGTFYTGTGVFRDKAYKAFYENNFKEKIIRNAPYLADEKVDRYKLKRFYSELDVPSLMGARLNAENQYYYFLMPFMDPGVASLAYEAVPYLGASYFFQQEMIRIADPELAAFPADYGYSFKEGEPLKDVWKYKVKDRLPIGVINHYINGIINRNTGELYHYLLQDTRFRNMFERFHDFIPELNYEWIAKLPDHFPILANLVFFYDQLENHASANKI